MHVIAVPTPNCTKTDTVSLLCTSYLVAVPHSGHKVWCPQICSVSGTISYSYIIYHTHISYEYDIILTSGTVLCKQFIQSKMLMVQTDAFPLVVFKFPRTTSSFSYNTPPDRIPAIHLNPP